MKPEIDFRHVLRELAVNQQEPTEVVRELISNAYDAGASNVWFAPLAQYDGFLFCDDGSGLDTENEIRGITPYRAFFSIGRSTKTSGAGVGYKCQGSKLCFASGLVAVITRSDGGQPGVWRHKYINNPSDELTTELDLTPDETSDPASTLRSLFDDGDQRTQHVLDEFSSAFFSKIDSGTLIVVKRFKSPKFGEHFLLGDSPTASYIYNYIRTATKHADTRRVTRQHGFPASAAAQLTKLADEHGAVASLRVWTGSEYIEIPAGYWYLDRGEADVSDPLKVSRLRDARFSTRNAQVIKEAEQFYSFLLAVDGNRRAHENYSSLDRKGKRISGIRLTDQRGTFVSAQGVKIAPCNDLLTSPHVDTRFHTLADAVAQAHYTLMIDGPFRLVTNRNALTQESVELIESPSLGTKLNTFLQRFYQRDQIFQALVDRLNKERIDTKLDGEQDALAEMKASVATRRRFRLEMIESLKDFVFVEPSQAEEHWVGALYTLVAHHVTADVPRHDLWPRPLTFSARGIDSVAQPFGSTAITGDSLVSVEYKYWFSNNELFNHPLIMTDHIVCWDFTLNADADGNVLVSDDKDYFGLVDDGMPDDEAASFVISRFESNLHGAAPGKTVVLSLRRILEQSFAVNFTTPPRRG